ncbi:MAG: hypothetical protein JHC95_13235, partial [Solirubrobacteraceae bacterium]|nr:hypothetical protein [Solirubrobacteraceae bacterium]
MLVAAGACALVAAPADAARTEQQLVTPPGPFAAVAKSLVTIDAPLPASVTGAPDACQQLQYYRYRRAAGPTDPQQSDAVFVNMPGVLAGSGSLEMNALEVVQDAADSGGSVEVWALNRRSNCLEDHTGLQAAAAAKDAGVALDYYLHGVP